MNKQDQDSSRLSPIFIAELCQACLQFPKILDVCVEHIKYHYLETEAQKRVFKNIIEHYQATGGLTTVGMISQNFSANKDVISFLAQVKSVKINKEESEALLLQLQAFLKHSQFVELFNNAHTLYQEGKTNQAIKYLAETSQVINDFAIKEKYYTTVFKDFAQREDQRLQASKSKEKKERGKIPTGIRELDEITFGGWRRKTSALILATSGGGKTTALRWHAISAARTGHIVVHFQIEGSEEECLEGYDAAWTATKLQDFDTLDYGVRDEKAARLIAKARKDIVGQIKGEIVVYAAESFDSITVEKSREILDDTVAKYGRVDLVIYDYLEVMETVKEYKDERKRREKIANNITNIAIEYNCATLTATQANDIDPKNKENPDFKMTRHHISEFKGALKPFSYFYTINATSDEYENDIVRIYCDKFRRYKAGQTITFAQKREIGRFYESERTLQHFYKDPHQPIKKKVAE